MIRNNEVFKIGRIGKPHGVKGETTLQFADDVFDRVDAAYLVIEIDGILVPFFIEEYRFRSDSVALMKFCDIDTMEQARQITGCNVFFPYSLTDSDDDSVTWAEIIGYHIIDTATGKDIGSITAVDDTTINVLFEVETTGGENVLIPASDDLIQGIDTKQRAIDMIIPKGILDL